MNTVYIAFYDVDYEGSEVIAVSTSKATAELAIEKDKDARTYPPDGYHIEQHLLRS
jgi:hypothetical protein